jgi:two-component system sensor histidine kinase/response regulator
MNFNMMTKESSVTVISSPLITRLLAIIAHDVKSPLDSILLTMNFLKENNSGPEDYIDFMTALELHIKFSKKILEDLIKWAKLLVVENRMNAETVVDINIKALTDEIIQSVQYFNLNKQISFVNKISGDLSYRINADLYTFVLRNLLMNSIKFSYENGKTYIDADIDYKHMRISVTDAGTRINPEKLNNILNFSGRSDRGTHNETGAGIGLILCYDCLQYFGGRLGVNSINGSDTEFFFEIPIRDIYELQSKN